MNEPRWIDRSALLFLHNASLNTYGGLPGIRDEGLLDSALARPRNRFVYEMEADLADLAASYGFGIVRNHPFVDGNKRAGFHAVGLFLFLNAHKLVATQVGAIQTVLNLAAGGSTEEQFAAWIREHYRPSSFISA